MRIHIMTITMQLTSDDQSKLFIPIKHHPCRLTIFNSFKWISHHTPILVRCPSINLEQLRFHHPIFLGINTDNEFEFDQFPEKTSLKIFIFIKTSILSLISKMFKSLIAVLLFVVLANANEATRLTDFIAKDLDGKSISFQRAQGNCVLISKHFWLLLFLSISWLNAIRLTRSSVNTGSGCGLTNANMKWLNTISKRYPELMVIAFPSNSFNQEKKSDEELKNW